MTDTTIDTIHPSDMPTDAPLPVGFCADCLRELLDDDGEGLAFTAVRLTPTLVALGAYCQHTACGGTMILGDDRPAVWQLRQPISREQFNAELRGLPASFAVASAHAGAIEQQRHIVN